MTRNPSVRDLPPGWKSGDSGVVLDDSSNQLPSDEELARALTSSEDAKDKRDKEPPEG